MAFELKLGTVRHNAVLIDELFETLPCGRDEPSDSALLGTLKRGSCDSGEVEEILDSPSIGTVVTHGMQPAHIDHAVMECETFEGNVK